MAAIVRRNWPVFLVLACACILTLSIVLPHALQTTTVAQVTDAQAKPTYTAQSPEDYDGLRNLRYELGLDNDALIALNLSSEMTEQVLATLRNWYEKNKVELTNHDLAVAQKNLALRQINKSLRTAPRVPNAATTQVQAAQELAAAQVSRQTLIQGTLTAVTAGLSNEQKTLLATLQANCGEPLPYRLITMTSDQKKALHTARRHYERQLAQARDRDTMQTLETAWRSQLAHILDRSQQERLTALAQYGEQAAERVLAAQQKIMPTPEEPDAATEMPQS